MIRETGVSRLPGPDALTEAQRRGAACIRCGSPLRPGHDDVDLGRQWDADRSVAWFPRACQPCHEREAR